MKAQNCLWISERATERGSLHWEDWKRGTWTETHSKKRETTPFTRKHSVSSRQARLSLPSKCWKDTQHGTLRATCSGLDSGAPTAVQKTPQSSSHTTTVLTQLLVVPLTVRDNRETARQTTSNSDNRRNGLSGATGYIPAPVWSNIEFEHGFWRETEVFVASAKIYSQSLNNTSLMYICVPK